jgi:hypothetical protein
MNTRNKFLVNQANDAHHITADVSATDTKPLQAFQEFLPFGLKLGFISLVDETKEALPQVLVHAALGCQGQHEYRDHHGGCRTDVWGA